MTVSEKVAYLKGLKQGLALDDEDKIVKVINAIIDTLDEVAEAMSELELDVVDISDQVDAVDEDLADIEDFIYDDDYEEDDELVKTKSIVPETIDLDEAIMRMEMLNHSFFIYRDNETKEVAVVYKRNDGGYGLIETE